MRILVYCHDQVGARLAGPAIRAIAIARALAARWDVTLGLRQATDAPPAGLRTLWPVRARDIARFDVVAAQALPVSLLGAAIALGKPLIFDGYDLQHVESLELYRDRAPRFRRLDAAYTRRRAAVELRGAAWIMASSERQRDFYLGQLALLGRISPAAYDASPTLSALVGTVPFGISDGDPGPERRLRSAIPGIGARDSVLLWGGGIWSWLDPLTAIRAMPAILERQPLAKLVFLGTRHPDPAVPAMRMAAMALDEARRLGLAGGAVIFNEGWVPFEERGAYFADADVGVSLHGDHIETRFAFRTRVLDYLWAALPMVLSAGDSLSETISGAGAGVAVPPGDPGAFASAVLAMLDPERLCAARERAAALRETLRWRRVLAPLVATIEGIERGDRPAAPSRRLRALAAFPMLAWTALLRRLAR